MNELIDDFNELQELFQDTVDQYPILEDDFNEIFDKDINEIEELVDKNDEYYLKKACSKLRDTIKKVKELSQDTKEAFEKFDSLTREWNNIEVTEAIEPAILEKINKQVKKSKELIVRKNYDSVKEAVKLLSLSVKELKEYAK